MALTLTAGEVHLLDARLERARPDALANFGRTLAVGTWLGLGDGDGQGSG